MRPLTLSEVDEYIQHLYAREDAALAHIRAEGEKRVPGMQISPQEGKLLHVLATLVNARHIAEVGTFMGYSTVWMARALPAEGTLTTFEKEPEHALLARRHFEHAGCEGKITVIEGDAARELARFQPSAPLDMVFIDAHKPDYPQYLELLLPHIRRGGLVVGDNTLLFGTVHKDWEEGDTSRESWNGMRRFNEMLADEKRFASLLISTPEGMTVAVKR